MFNVRNAPLPASAVLLGLLSLASLPATAATVTYDITVNTSDLLSVNDAPYAIDLQMNYGGIGAGNTATVSNFNVVGTGAPIPYLGTYSGNIASGFQLTDSTASPFNEVAQTFTAGSTLSFQVTLTENTTGQTPDGFSFGIDEGSDTFEFPTTGPGGNAADNSGTLALFNIRGPNFTNPVDFTTYQGTGEYSGVTVTVAPVPLPASAVLMLGGLCGLGAALRKRRA